MKVQEVVAQRGIESLFHFTTNRGCLGVLATRYLKGRALLADDKALHHILQMNAIDRSRDAKWHEFVNLSISRINSAFFRTCSERWHRDKDFWWCALEFSADVMADEGVYFTTTNNMYSGVARSQGGDGLEALYAPSIVQWAGQYVHRHPTLHPRFTTCEQAEVLYPRQISTDLLRAIYVRDEEHCDEVAGQLSGVRHPNVDIILKPELFKPME
jgi:hypothetical protein